MKRLAVMVLSAIGVVTLSVGLALAMPGKAAAEARHVFDVFISNDAKSPIPVAGSVAVSALPAVQVASLPAVQSQQAGKWSVAVDGPVSLSGPVTVASNPQSPLSVTCTNAAACSGGAPARTPVTANGISEIGDDISWETPILVVPDGKILVIEFASALIVLPHDNQVSAILDVGSSGVPIPCTKQLHVNFGGFDADHYACTQPMAVSLGAGSAVSLSGLRDQASGGVNCSATIGGYLIDAP